VLGQSIKAFVSEWRFARNFSAGQWFICFYFLVKILHNQVSWPE
jgi:hypothetical protein